MPKGHEIKIVMAGGLSILAEDILQILGKRLIIIGTTLMAMAICLSDGN